MKNAKVIKFNLSKKLSQLNKVITFFKFQQADYDFEKEQLHKIYDRQIQDLLEKCCKEKESLKESIVSDEQTIIFDVDRVCQQRYEKMKNDFESMVATSKVSHQTQLQNVQKEVSIYSKLLNHFTAMNDQGKAILMEFSMIERRKSWIRFCH